MSGSNLEKLDSLRREGVLSERAYWDARSRLGAPTAPTAPPASLAPPPAPPQWSPPNWPSPASPPSSLPPYGGPPPPPPPPTPPPPQRPGDMSGDGVIWDEPAERWNSAPGGWTAPPVRMSGATKHLRGRARLVGGLVLALVVAAGAISYAVSRPGDGTTMRVDFALTDNATAAAGCVGQGDDAAFRAGRPVTLSGSQGRRLTAAPLGHGDLVHGRCQFSVAFADIETTDNAYTISMAHGLTRHLTRAALRAGKWHVDVNAGPPTRQVKGTLTLYDPTALDHDCVIDGAYRALNDRPRVVVKDASGHVIGSAKLGPAQTGPSASCEYDFVLKRMRDDERAYTVDVAGVAHRTETAAQLRDSEWRFVVQIFT